MAIERFQIQVLNKVLDDLKYRLDHIRWPDQLADTGWERGADIGYLQSLISYWREKFDWREQETELNRFSQYRCHIEGINIHFVYEHGKGPNPIPLILTHGWPDSFLRYRKIVPLLTDPARHG